MVWLYRVSCYGVLVPVNVKYVTASDGYNTLFRNGSETEKGCQSGEIMTRERYLEKYAELYNGLYYWKENYEAQFRFDKSIETTYYWVGPFNMLVPSHIRWVMTEDDTNTITRDGEVTEEQRITTSDGEEDELLEKDEYLERYAIQGQDGNWYYNEQ